MCPGGHLAGVRVTGKDKNGDAEEIPGGCFIKDKSDLGYSLRFSRFIKVKGGASVSQT